MAAGLLQASIKNRGIVLDPRTKFLLLITMSIFVLGGAGGMAGRLMPVFCAMPAIALLSAKKLKQAATYVSLYCLSGLAVYFLGGRIHGFLNFLIMGICGILLRFLPCLMMGWFLPPRSVNLQRRCSEST